MKLHMNQRTNQNMFTAHGAGYVSVNSQRYEHSLVVMPDQLHLDWRVSDFEALNEAHFSYLLALQPEILLLGTGAQQKFPHPRLFQTLIAAGISVEAMSTSAACRTYNILMSEDRKVVAAILIS